MAGLKTTAGRHTLRFKCVGKNKQSKRFYFGLDYIDVTGLKPTPRPNSAPVDDQAVIRARLKTLLRRAFRRPVDPVTLDRFTRFAKGRLASGSSFEDTMRTIVGAVLGMPDFLYFYESTDKKTSRTSQQGREPVNDFELASRLARFIWSSIPDDELLDLAIRGELRAERRVGTRRRARDDGRSGQDETSDSDFDQSTALFAHCASPDASSSKPTYRVGFTTPSGSSPRNSASSSRAPFMMPSKA